MNETEFILDHLEKMARNLEELVSYFEEELSAIYVDGTQQVNLICVEDALEILDSFGKNCASEIIGKTDYILVYDASKKLNIDGEAYLPAGYLVMKSDYGLKGLDESEISSVLAELRSRTCTFALGQHRIQTYRLG
ncbi:MAG: hypothetical protein PUF65_01290 [Lachnospiraceae bacterium]|nr:hypothetical protein [Lachnospiraceae bacterium]